MDGSKGGELLECEDRGERSNKAGRSAALFSRQAGRAIMCTFQRVMAENKGPLAEFSSSTVEGGHFK